MSNQSNNDSKPGSFVFPPLVRTDNIEVVDIIGTLVMVQPKASCNDPDALNSRGAVFNGDQLICRSLPFTVELIDDQITPDHMPDMSQITVYPSYEGTLIRVFHFNDTWFISTHRRFNADISRWGSVETFGEMFDAALAYICINGKSIADSATEKGVSVRATFLATLDITKQYMFLLPSTSKNHVVCDAFDEQAIIHIGTFVDTNTLRFDIDCGIPRLSAIHLNSYEEMLAYVRGINPRGSQGVLCFLPQGQVIKVINSVYNHMRTVRGNEPSIKIRYLQIRNNQVMVAELKALYPDHVTMFDEYEVHLATIAKTIYGHYVNRFVHRNNVVVARDMFQVMKAAHTWYITQKMHGQNGRVTLQVITRLLHEQPHVALNNMINQIKPIPSQSLAMSVVDALTNNVKRARLV